MSTETWSQYENQAGFKFGTILLLAPECYDSGLSSPCLVKILFLGGGGGGQHHIHPRLASNLLSEDDLEILVLCLYLSGAEVISVPLLTLF